MSVPTVADVWPPLRSRQALREHAFRSPVPFVAWLRELWNGISTKWYVRPLIQQQSEFNQLVVDRLVSQQAQLDHGEHIAEDHATRLNAQELSIQDHIARLDGLHAQVQGCTARLTNLDNAVGDHDLWSVEKDREQSHLTRTLAEVTAQVIHLNRLVGDLDQRLARLEATQLASPRSE